MDSTENPEVIGERLYQAKKYDGAVKYFTKVSSNKVLNINILEVIGCVPTRRQAIMRNHNPIRYFMLTKFRHSNKTQRTCIIRYI